MKDPIVSWVLFVAMVMSTLVLFMLFPSQPSEREQKQQFIDQHFPTDATNIVEIGNDWYTFELDGNCFLYHDYYRKGRLATIPCGDK